jgi:formylglycine-generating enzyme required for sulfatase activity
MPQDNRPLRVFLCHSSGDKQTVSELHHRLSSEKWIDPWLDELKLLPGHDWHLEIEKAVELTDAVIVFLSNNSVVKEGFVQRELKYVLDIADEKPEGTIFIIPLRLEDCPLPRRLRKWQYVDYFPDDRKDLTYERVISSLKIRAETIGILLETVTPLPDETQKKIVPQLVGGLEFVHIPAGSFLMGNEKDYTAVLPDYDVPNYKNEKPQHTVNIPYDYWIGRFLVTNKQHAHFAKTTRSNRSILKWPPAQERKEFLQHPIVGVSWKDIQAYLDWFNDSQHSALQEGFRARLPTEAEWEKAARGTNSFEWPWGNEFDENKCNSAEWHGLSESGAITPVGYFSPEGDSPYGCVDMAGNVWEWTQSLMKPYPYNSEDGRENLQTQGSRVLRGGCFDLKGAWARCACRITTDTFPKFAIHSFRPAMGVQVLAHELSFDPLRYCGFRFVLSDQRL